jgi:hypothetical protein
MAQLSLGLAGTALIATGNPVGVVAGIGLSITAATLGTYLDEQYVYPALFGEDRQQPQLEDIKVQTASEGSPIVRCLGPSNRVAGQLLWVGEPYARTITNRIGKNNETATQVWLVNVAIAWCDNRIERVDKILIDGKTEYDANTELPVTVTIGPDTVTYDEFLPGIRQSQGAFTYFANPSFPLVHDQSSTPSWGVRFTEQVPNTGLGDIPEGENLKITVRRQDLTGNGVSISRPLASFQADPDGDGTSETFTEYGVLGTINEGRQTANFETVAGTIVRGWRFLRRAIPGTNPVRYEVFVDCGDLARFLLSTIPPGAPNYPNTYGGLVQLPPALNPWNPFAATDGNQNRGPLDGAVVTFEWVPPGREGERGWNREVIDIVGDTSTTYEENRGDRDQEQSALLKRLQNASGFDDPPNYLSIAYSALEGLNISRYGNRVPNMNAILRESASIGVGSAIDRICWQAGFDAASVDTLFLRSFVGFADVTVSPGASTFNASINLANPNNELRTNDYVAIVANDGSDTILWSGLLDDVTPDTFGGTLYAARLAAPGRTLPTAGTYVSAQIWREPAKYAVQGYQWAGIQETTAVLQPLLIAYDVEAVPRGDKIVFRPKNESASVSIPAGELDTRLTDDEAASPLEITPVSDSELPDELVVRFSNVENDLLDGTESDSFDFLVSPAAGRNTRQFEFTGLALTTSQAKALARRLLRSSRETRASVSFRLPARWAVLEPGDIVTFPELNERDGFTYRIRVDEIDVGADERVDVRGSLLSGDAPQEDPAGDSNATALAAFSALEQPVGGVQPILWQTVDVGFVRESHVLTPGFYAAAAPYDREATFRGATVWRDRGDGELEIVGTVPSTFVATIGSAEGCADALQDPVLGLFDRQSLIRVRLQSGVIMSRTEEAVLAGANRAKLGDELIAYASAVLQPDGSYLLGNLLRGIGGSPTAHASDLEPFVAIDDALVFVPMPVNQIGVRRKVIIAPQAEEPVPEIAVATTLQSWHARPAAPTAIQYAFGTSDVTVTWQRVSRLPVRTLFQDPPLVEGSEAYDVEFRKAGAVVELARVATNTITRSYTTSDVDEVRIAQVDKITGRGRWTTRSLT